MTAATLVDSLKLKHVATINDEALGDDTDPNYEIRYIDISNVDSSGRIGKIASYRFEQAPLRARRRVRDGDIVISTVRTHLQAIAQVRRPPANLLASTGFAVVRPRPERLVAEYCKYALREPSFLAAVEMRSVGVSYPAIAVLDLAGIKIPVPGLSRQRAIADYLDCETARIDALIAAKERTLKLLAEKRRALITRAVTRGVGLDTAFRASGFSWLGEIPAHWKVTRLKFVGQVQTGLALGKRYQSRAMIEYPYLRVANVQDGFLDLSDVKTVSVPAHEAEFFLLRAGDLLMNEGGDADKLGRGAIWTGEIAPCLHQNHVFAVRARDISSAWLALWTSSDHAKAYFESRSKQSTKLASISASNLMEMPLLQPPHVEQAAIVEAVHGLMNKIDAVRSAAKGTIGLLKERRTALISAAVTGRIDVEAAT